MRTVDSLSSGSETNTVIWERGGAAGAAPAPRYAVQSSLGTRLSRLDVVWERGTEVREAEPVLVDGAGGTVLLRSLGEREFFQRLYGAWLAAERARYIVCRRT